MSRKITAALATLAVAAPFAVPSLASASSWIQTRVARGFSTQTHNRARLSGIRITQTAVRCANDGGGSYSCYATYTGLWRGHHYKYGIYINASSNGAWRTVGSAQLVRAW